MQQLVKQRQPPRLHLKGFPLLVIPLPMPTDSTTRISNLGENQYWNFQSHFSTHSHGLDHDGLDGLFIGVTLALSNFQDGLHVIFEHTAEHLPRQGVRMINVLSRARSASSQRTNNKELCRLLARGLMSRGLARLRVARGRSGCLDSDSSFQKSNMGLSWVLTKNWLPPVEGLSLLACRHGTKGAHRT